MSLRARVLLVCFVVCHFCNFLITHSAAAAERCESPAGRLVSVQGDVGVQATGASTWLAVGLDHTLCPGDTVRVGKKSRAAVVLVNESVLRIGENSALTIGNPTPEKVSLLKLLQGILHIFSHRPHSLNIATPFVSGAVEGTEFLVRVMPDRAFITVFEGRVLAANGMGELAVSSGQSIVAAAGQAPRYETVVRPRDAVQWTLYYPPIIDRPADKDGRLGSSPLAAAVDALAVGSVDEARRLIAGVLEKNAGNADALALLSIIELTRNNTQEAGRLAAQATTADQNSVAAAMATAYVRQATFDIPGALATLEEARQANPESAELLARLAELQLSVGDLDRAEASAMQAAALNPNIGRSQAVLGFAHLTRIETDKAKEAFSRAIALDPAMPLARLGLGLALIREGELEEGRAEIEIAAALDPGNALIRSYLGKAYYEEKRDGGAARQYEIAKELDPADPTPWFYDALRKQSINRPVEALHDLQKSIELNDNRAVYRSRLLLDEDLAVRSVGLASIYNDLGFEKLALVDGVKSVGIDPSNYSAHRFLSDIYSSQPRHQIARVSELLQSQLLQPVNGNPVHPQSAQSDLQIFREVGLSESAFNEYTPLFQRDKISLTASGLIGGYNTWGDEVVVSGLIDNISASIGGMQYNTDGFRENNDQYQDIFDMFSKVALSPDTDLMAEYRNFDRNFGDIPLRFDPYLFYANDRSDESSETIRLGVHHAFSPKTDLIGTIIAGDYNFEYADKVFNNFIDQDESAVMVEVQSIVRFADHNLLFGVSYFNGESDENTMFSGYATIPEEHRSEDTRLYAYFNYSMTDTFIWTLGANAEFFEGGIVKDIFLPKLGATWTLFPTTTLRAVIEQTLGSHLIADQTLEPTQVAGFNQFYDDPVGTDAWRYGVAVDQKLGDSGFGGIELSRRDLDTINDDGYSVTKETEWQEEQLRMYLSWAPATWIATTVEFSWDEYERDPEFVGMESIRSLSTKNIPISLNLFCVQGITAVLKATYVDQKGEFVTIPDSNPILSVTEDGDDHFWVLDASLRYRLPKRYGLLSLEVKNLLDEKFQFQTMDPAFPEYVPERWVFGKVTIFF